MRKIFNIVILMFIVVFSTNAVSANNVQQSDFDNTYKPQKEVEQEIEKTYNENSETDEISQVDRFTVCSTINAMPVYSNEEINFMLDNTGSHMKFGYFIFAYSVLIHLFFIRVAYMLYKIIKNKYDNLK